jgi:hypothetical protein
VDITHGSQRHINRVPFKGVLCFLDVPSDKSPTGARGHKVLLTTMAAQESLHTLLGMPLSVSECFSKHADKRKCGVITRVYINGNELRIEGHIFGEDYPEVIEVFKSDAVLGLSYEQKATRIDDMFAATWVITRTTFMGAGLMYADKAAYKSTSIELI